MKYAFSIFSVLHLVGGTIVFTAGCGDSPSQSAKKFTPVDTPSKSASAVQPSTKAAAAPVVQASATDDRFQVPSGNADELLAFVERLVNPEPFANPAEAQAYQRNAGAAIGVATERVLAGEPTGEQAQTAIEYKLMSLRIAADQTGAPPEDVEKYLDKMLADARPPVKQAATRVRLQRDLAQWQRQDTAARLAAIERYTSAVKENGLSLQDARMLISLADTCSKQLFATSSAAAEPFRAVAPLFRASSDPKIVELANLIEGMTRRLELPGKKLALAGTRTDGTPFDWDSYRGKVVLVDFWATDCEECIAEMPNLARAHRLYREKGFDVVGVNLNWNLDEVKKAIEQTGMVWPTLFEKHSDEIRWAHPVADNLGIDSLPQMMLVDKDGTVVHANARGPALLTELRKLLGEPIIPAEEKVTVELPDGSIDDVMKYVEGQIKALPQPRSETEKQQYLAKVRGLLTAAVERILSSDPNVNQAGEAIQLKIASLRMSDFGPEEGDRQLMEFLGQLAAHPRPAVKAAAAEIQMMRAADEWDIMSAEERKTTVERYAALAKEWGPSTNHVSLISRVASMAGLTNDEQLMAAAAGRILPLFADRSNPQIAEAASILEGIERRMKLPGQKLELSGTLLGGGNLDWESYRGKVVLVDFWASWCGPCREEVPNIRRNLQLYGSKGFAVLGICLDDNRANAQAYIDQAGVTWPSLASNKPTEAGFDHPISRQYGITSIPMAILVDQQGKVVNLWGRGPVLGEKLKELLGEPAPSITN